MAKLMVVLALNTMQKPTHTSSLWVLNKDTPFTAKTVTRNPKYNGVSVMNKANITAQFTLAEETQCTKSTS